MIAFWSVSIAFVLLLLMVLLGAKQMLSQRELQDGFDALDGDAVEPCPREFAERIFARSDWEFVSKLKSRGIENFFQRERKSVALLWVQQTASRIRRVMREHGKAVRSSRDLEFATEVKLFWRYSELMLVCGVLFISIYLAGPMRLRGLAIYAQALSQRIAEAQERFQTATGTSNVSAIG